MTALAPHAFYAQDAAPDDDDATSDGIRVSSDVVVAVGDVVRVAGTVREVRPGCAACAPTSEAFANLTVTQIEATDVAIVGHAPNLPSAVRIGSGAGEAVVRRT